MKTIFVLIPVLNESPNINRLAAEISKWNQEIQDHSFQFIFINDGSTDNTPELLKSLEKTMPVHTLHHAQKMGPGKAFATGFTFLSGKISEQDLVVTMEGDNTSRPHILKMMIGRVEREGNEVVLASPYSFGGGISNTSFLRTFLSHGANSLMKIALNLRGINTFSSFYRLYTGSAVLALQKKYGPGIIESAGFECMVELLFKIVQLQLPLSEISMRLDTSLRAGKSKMNVLRTMRGYLRLMLTKNRWK